MADKDLTDLVKNMDFDTEPSGWAEEPNETFVEEISNVVPRRNAPRNIRNNEDQTSLLSGERSMGAEASLEDSMEAIDFFTDKFQSGNLDMHPKKEKVTIQTSLPNFSMAREQGENTLSTLALTTTFDDDVNKSQIFETSENDAAFQNMCRTPISAGNNVCINASCHIMVHEGVRRANIPQGQLYIQRNKFIVNEFYSKFKSIYYLISDISYFGHHPN